MTTFVSPHSHSQNPPPISLDQITPQLPSSSLMTDSHAASNAMLPIKLPNNTITPPPSSLGNVASNPASQNISNSLLTPAIYGAPNSTLGDSCGDSLMVVIEQKPHKRRRTDSTFDSDYHTLPPSLRQSNTDADRNLMETSPSIPQMQELLSKPDCSPYYLVCEKSHQQSYPDHTENLLQIYGLKPIADKVARFDASGKKNKLRKSYKGHIAGLSGKIEVVARPTQLGQNPIEEAGGDPNEYKLQRLAYYPDEEWHLQNVLGKDLDRGLDLTKLRRGLVGITKGDIPGYDSSVLGLDDDLPRKRPENAKSPLVTTGAIGTPQKNGSTPGNASTVSGGVNGDEIRPKRMKRRRYDEGSYEGYDGFDEDDSSMNSGNGPGGGGWEGDKKKKKRKKNTDVNSPGMNFTHHEIVVKSGMIYGR